MNEMDANSLPHYLRSPSRIFRNLPIGESGTSPFVLTAQGFEDLNFSWGKVFPKQTQIARIIGPMDHAVTVSA
jgi:hypothetical protein